MWLIMAPYWEWSPTGVNPAASVSTWGRPGYCRWVTRGGRCQRNSGTWRGQSECSSSSSFSFPASQLTTFSGPESDLGWSLCQSFWILDLRTHQILAILLLFFLNLKQITCTVFHLWGCWFPCLTAEMKVLGLIPKKLVWFCFVTGFLL